MKGTSAIRIRVLRVLAALCLFSSSAFAISNGVVISQIYGGGGNSGASLKNAGWSVQYASSGGTSWQRTALSGTIPAGGYYLVQEAAGTTGPLFISRRNSHQRNRSGDRS